MPRHPMYNTARWRAKRAALLKASPLCVMCAKAGRTTPATIADHVIPHRGNVEAFWAGDLQPLCATCHSAIKQAAEAGSGLRGADIQGRPLDPDHLWNK